MSSFGIILSCEDDDTLVPGGNYLPLSIGNNWGYQHVRIDTLGNEQILSTIDSVWMASDTIICGQTNYVFKGTPPLSSELVWGEGSIYRDTLNFLVDEVGDIHFSSEDFESVLNGRHIVASKL